MGEIQKQIKRKGNSIILIGILLENSAEALNSVGFSSVDWSKKLGSFLLSSNSKNWSSYLDAKMSQETRPWSSTRQVIYYEKHWSVNY